MWTPQAQSKRLLFFTVRDAYDKTWQCIAKERDGFLDEYRLFEQKGAVPEAHRRMFKIFFRQLEAKTIGN